MNSKATIGKRASGRTIVISKSMRIVDDETRKEETAKRIKSLDSDAYMEELMAYADENSRNDDAYDDNEVFLVQILKYYTICYKIQEDGPSSHKKPKLNRNSNSSKSKQQLSKWLSRKFKTLDRIIDEQRYTAENAPNYLTINANPSKYPKRHFCSLCGSIGSYTCVRCGSRVCTNKCLELHKESVCMKVGY